MSLRRPLQYLRSILPPHLTTLPTRPPRTRLAAESLEDRLTPTTTVYIDFGDRFPTDGLGMTVQQLRETISGPNLTVRTNTATGKRFQDGENLTFRPMANSVTFNYNGDRQIDAADVADLRRDTLALVRRYYAPFDVTVVVASAANLNDITNTLAANNNSRTGKNDAYVIVGAMTPGAAGLRGLAAGADLKAGSNTSDECALVFSDVILGGNIGQAADTSLARTIAHEAAHTFGLSHTVNPAQGTDQDLLTDSDIIREGPPGADQTRNVHFFTRFPLPLDGGGLQNSYDKLVGDPDIGRRAGAPAYVTGTGAHDTILITRDREFVTQAAVTVQPFRDAARTQRIGDSYTYTIPIGAGVLVDAGLGDDEITIESALAADFTVRGMGGNDHLVVMGLGQASGKYFPGLSAPTGLDGRDSFGGSVRVGNCAVSFSEFDGAASSVTVTDVGHLSIRSPGGDDSWRLDETSTGDARVTGKSDATAPMPTPITPLIARGVGRLTVDVSTGDFPFLGDAVVLERVPAGLPVSVVTGLGINTISVEDIGTGSPVTIQGGPGNDNVLLSPLAKNMDNIRSNITVVGGDSGFDGVVGYDTNSPLTPTYLLSSSAMFRLARRPTVNLEGVEGAGFFVSDRGSTTLIASTNGTIVGVFGGTGDDMVDVRDGSAIGGFFGGGGNDTLLGPSAATVWAVSGENAGGLRPEAAGIVDFKFKFVEVENVQGGTGRDVYQFTDASNLTGSLTDRGGADYLDYRTFGRTADVVVDLSAGAASGVRGRVGGVEHVLGGTGGNRLTGDGGANLLIGGGTVDIIHGGGGRDILIGGLGADLLFGEGDEDILIGGRTLFDLNPSALEPILAEWNSARDYQRRVANLSGTGTGERANGQSFLTVGGTAGGGTVFGDDAQDDLTGGGGADWFFASLGGLSDVTDQAAGEIVTRT